MLLKLITDVEKNMIGNICCQSAFGSSVVDLLILRFRSRGVYVVRQSLQLLSALTVCTVGYSEQ